MDLRISYYKEDQKRKEANQRIFKIKIDES